MEEFSVRMFVNEDIEPRHGGRVIGQYEEGLQPCKARVNPLLAIMIKFH